MRKTHKLKTHEKDSWAGIGFMLILVLAIGIILPNAGLAAVGDPLLHNSLTTSSSKWTGTGGWGVAGGKYGQFVCTTCHTSSTTNIKRIKSSITTPDPSKGALPGDGQPILFTRTAGTLRGVTPGTMGDDGFTPRASSNRICEICHTYDATKINGVSVHPYAVGVALSDHQGADGDDCTSCHKHSEGFKAPACDSCHGNPPIASTLGGPNGLANTPHTTRSTTAGAHNAHVNTFGITNCNACHNTYTMPNTFGSTTYGEITVKFSAYGYTSGSYSGQSNVGYAGPTGTYFGTGSKTCSNVYCHSNGVRTGTVYASPVWDNPATAACGTCHGINATTPPASSAHTQHVGSTSTAMYKFACSKCHPDVASQPSSTYATTITNTTQHVNGGYNITFDSYNPGGTYSSERCSNVYCHSLGNTSVTPGQLVSAYGGTIYSTVAWTAGNLACNSCHGKSTTNGYPDYTSGGQGVATSNSHSAHASPAASNISCSECHYQTTTTGTTIRTDVLPTKHVNKDIRDVSFNPASNPSASFASGTYTCSSTYCHGVNIVWGAPGPLACNACHGASNVLQGKHSQHYESTVTATNLNAFTATTTTQYRFNCGVCHYSTAHAGGEVQANIQSAQVSFDPTVAGGGTYTAAATRAGVDTGNRNWTAGVSGYPCNNTYCHSQGTTVTGGTYSVAVSTMSWTGSYTLGCNGCHGDKGNPTDTSGKPMYTNDTLKKNSHAVHNPWGTLQNCQACHYQTTTTGTTITNKQLHLNKAYNINAYGAGGVWTTLFSFTATTANDGTTCASNQCHAGQTAKWGSIGSGSGSAGDWNCISCHSYSFPKRLGGLGTIRMVVGAAGDFNMGAVPSGSRHLFGATTIVKWDCIVCHREGQATGTNSGGVNWSYHWDTGGLVHLRNVDTINETIGWAINNRAWTTTDYTNMDNFCLSCHDLDGASQIAVNATNNGLYTGTAAWNSMRAGWDSWAGIYPGRAAFAPFNSTDWRSGWLEASTWSTTSGKRARVIDVKSQFYAGTQVGANYDGNPSQHAVLGKRYSTVNQTGWGSLAWGTVMLKKMGVSMRVARETAILTCADCHVLDTGSGAHGGVRKYNMWASSVNDGICARCHATTTYNTATASGLSRFTHAYSRAGVTAYGLPQGASTANANCFNCHASWEAMTTLSRQQSYGGIHGSWTSWVGWNTARSTAWWTFSPYRFFPGTYRRLAWTTAGGDGVYDSTKPSACYFVASGNNPQTFTSCSSHSAGQIDASRAATVPPYARPVKY